MTQATSRVKNSLYNISTGVGYQILVLIISFIVRTIFIYCLGKTYLGVNGLFSNVLSILSFAELGIGQAIIFSLYKPIAEGDEERMLSLMTLFRKVYRILFFVVLGLGLSLMPFLPDIINDYGSIKGLNIIYLMYVISSASSYLFAYKSTFLTACQKNFMVTIYGAAFYITISILQIVTLLIFKNFFVYLSIQISFGIIQNIFVAHKVNRIFPFLKRKDPHPLSKEDLKKIKKDVYALVLYKLGAISLNSTDNILISKFVGIIAVGIYSNYLIITSSISSFLGTIFANITASIGHLNATESDERKYFMFRLINLSTFWLYSYAAICIYILIDPFIGTCWLGYSFLLDKNTVLIICLNLYIVAMLYTPAQFRQTMGLFAQGKYRPLISAVLNIAISIVLGKYYGLAGVLWGTAITRLSTNAWYDPFLVFRKLKISPWKYYLDYISKFALMLAVGALCSWISSLFPIKNIFDWVVTALLLSLFINSLYIAIYRKTAEYKYLKDIVRKIFFKLKNTIANRLLPKTKL